MFFSVLHKDLDNTSQLSIHKEKVYSEQKVLTRVQQKIQQPINNVIIFERLLHIYSFNKLNLTSPYSLQLHFIESSVSEVLSGAPQNLLFTFFPFNVCLGNPFPSRLFWTGFPRDNHEYFSTKNYFEKLFNGAVSLPPNVGQTKEHNTINHKIFIW